MLEAVSQLTFLRGSPLRMVRYLEDADVEWYEHVDGTLPRPTAAFTLSAASFNGSVTAMMVNGVW